MSDWQDCQVSRDTSIREAMQRIEACRRRVALVTASDGRLQGVVTDGDIRRGILDGMSLEAPVAKVMNRDPVVAREGSDPEHVAHCGREGACRTAGDR
jgi:CBS domain-containing protein